MNKIDETFGTMAKYFNEMLMCFHKVHTKIKGCDSKKVLEKICEEEETYAEFDKGLYLLNSLANFAGNVSYEMHNMLEDQLLVMTDPKDRRAYEHMMDCVMAIVDVYNETKSRIALFESES